MASKTEICNLAISHLGTAKEIADLDTENSQEANACRRFYSIALEATLRDFDWPFARRFRSLSLVEEEPTDEWDYSYRYPNDALVIRRILSGVRNDSRQTRVSFIESADDTGKLIFTDEYQAEVQYTAKSENPQVYPSDFVIAFSYRLAYYISPRITGGEAFSGITKSMMDYYMLHLSNAKRNAMAEEQRDEVVDSEFIRGRE